MKQGWVTTTLREVAKTQYGLSEGMNEVGDGFKIFRMGEVQGGRLIDTGRMKRAAISTAEFERYALRKGDVLFNRTNSFELVGKTGIFDLDGEYCFASYLVRLTVNRDRLLPEFLNYFMNSAAFQASVKAKASRSINQANINASILANETVCMPESLEEQRRIVAILDEAFEGFATAKANTEKSLRNARELFDACLGAALAQAGEGVQLSKRATDISDGDHVPPPKSPTGVPFITISNVDKETRRIDFRNTFTVAPEYFRALKPHRKPQRGDVLYTVTGSFGIPVLVEDDTEFCFQRHIGLIRPKPDMDSRWLVYALLSPQVRAQAEAGATGTAQRTVSLGVLRNITIPDVGTDEQRRIASQLDALSEQIDRLKDNARAKLAALEELKHSLLHAAFNGGLSQSDDRHPQRRGLPMCTQ